MHLIENHESILVPAFTFLLGLILGHRLALGRDKRKEFNDAASRFKSAFVEGIHRLSDQERQNDLYEFLETNFASFKKAVISFRSYLPKRKRKSFDKSWNMFRYGISAKGIKPEMELSIPVLVQYSEALSIRDNRENARNLILFRIENLLAYGDRK